MESSLPDVITAPVAAPYPVGQIYCRLRLSTNIEPFASFVPHNLHNYLIKVPVHRSIAVYARGAY
jgi:hypothetical protein